MASSIASRLSLPSVATRGRSTNSTRMRPSLPAVNFAGYIEADIGSPLISHADRYSDPGTFSPLGRGRFLSPILEGGELFAEVQAAMAALTFIGHKQAGDLLAPCQPLYSPLEFRTLQLVHSRTDLSERQADHECGCPASRSGWSDRRKNNFTFFALHMAGRGAAILSAAGFHVGLFNRKTSRQECRLAASPGDPTLAWKCAVILTPALSQTTLNDRSHRTRRKNKTRMICNNHLFTRHGMRHF